MTSATTTATTARGLTARVKRLEAVVGMGQKYCPRCRYELRHTFEDPKRPAPTRTGAEDCLVVACQCCGGPRTVSLVGLSEEEREVVRTKHSFILEDIFRDPRAHAFTLWEQHQAAAIKHVAEGRKAAAGRSASSGARLSPAAAGGKEKLSAREAETRRVADRLVEAVLDFWKKKIRVFQDKYGESPFPEHFELVEAARLAATEAERAKEAEAEESHLHQYKGLYPRGAFDLEMAVINYAICAALEKIVWGGGGGGGDEPRPATLAAIESLREERNALYDAERERVAEPERRRLEEERLRLEAEAKQAEEERQRAEADRQQAEAERQQAEAERQRQEEEQAAQDQENFERGVEEDKHLQSAYASFYSTKKEPQPLPRTKQLWDYDDPMDYYKEQKIAEEEARRKQISDSLNFRLRPRPNRP